MAFGSMQLLAGQLDRRVKILRQTTIIVEHEPQETYVHAMTLWARVRYLKVDELYEAESVRAFKIARFMIRFRVDVTDNDRLEYDGKTYKIIGINEIGRREALEITGEYVEGLADA